MSMRMVILGVAVLAAGGAGYLAMNMSAPPQLETVGIPQPEVELDMVLVAADTIQVGSRIDGQLKWQKWPTGAIEPDYITQSSRPDARQELAESIVRATIVRGEPVRPIKVLGNDERFMSSILPAGKRAVATTIAADTSAGGFILPNDHVDVMMTTRGTTANSFRSEKVLSNIRVLAIDQTIREDENGQLVQVGQTATLELTPQEVEIITVAQQMADQLTLALRSIKDIEAGHKEKNADHLASRSVTVFKAGQRTEVSGQ